MSVNSGPAKVRVLSSGTPGPTPARRRGDIGGPGANDGDALKTAPVVEAEQTQSGAKADASMLWIVGAVALFVIGCAVGGVLVTVSTLYPGLLW